MSNKTDTEILIDYIKKYSISPTPSPKFLAQVNELFEIKKKDGADRHLKLAEITDDIHYFTINTSLDTQSPPTAIPYDKLKKFYDTYWEK